MGYKRESVSLSISFLPKYTCRSLPQDHQEHVPLFSSLPLAVFFSLHSPSGRGTSSRWHWTQFFRVFWVAQKQSCSNEPDQQQSCQYGVNLNWLIVCLHPKIFTSICPKSENCNWASGETFTQNQFLNKRLDIRLWAFYQNGHSSFNFQQFFKFLELACWYR